MTKIVYWSPWAEPNRYIDSYLSYSEPVGVSADCLKKLNRENKQDNFFHCPAFINQIKNTFLFKSPTNCDVEFKDGQIFNRTTGSFGSEILALKNPSMINSHTISFSANWIFFSEEDLEIESRHPFLHETQVSKYGFYVPGSMNISSWFRPLEYAFQCWPNVNEFKVDQEDPLMYVKVNTNDNLVFKKFYLTKELFDLSISCVRLKNYHRERNLKNLYNIFNASKIRSKILKEIKNNIMD